MSKKGLMKRLDEVKAYFSGRDGCGAYIDDIEEAQDIIFDYEDVAADYELMRKNYAIASDAHVARKNGIIAYRCPVCGQKVEKGQRHCGKCGKKLKWKRG